MMMNMLFLFLIFFSFFMFFLNHPLSMGLMILIQTFLICFLSGMFLKTYWFSYILFLTFLGGLLVLFIYISSIASNELFKMSLSLKIYLIMFWIISIITSYMYMYNFYWMNFFNIDMINFFNNIMFFNNENIINLSKLYNNQTYLLMILMMIYLFISLTAVVKITNIFYGPLRSNF